MMTIPEKQRKLKAAADLVDQVIADLDTSEVPCDAGHTHFANVADARVYERIRATPDKLRTAANALTGHIRALAAPCQEKR